MENEKRKVESRECYFKLFVIRCSLSIIFCVFLWSFSSCSSAPTDLRAFVPADAIVYLESKDLGETLDSLIRNPAWENGAAEAPDFSQLKNIQVAVAVTDFETAETQVTTESSVLKFKPHFVAVADTHQWKPTAVSIAENQVGRYARQIYGAEIKFEKSEKRDAKFFVWTNAADGRKLFAAVSGGVIYVGNDENLIDKCLSVGRGEAESLAKNENLARAREESAVGAEKDLAFGYISSAGVGQIANLLGVSAAMQVSEQDAIKSFVAKNLPEIIGKSAKEIIWTARKNERGIEDKIIVKTDPEASTVFRETLPPAANQFQSSAEFLPQQQFESVTFYNLQNPQLAWRSVLLVASKQMDAMSARLLINAANAFFAPYGIADGEGFLSAIGSNVVTARFDEDGENSVVIADVKDLEKIKKSIFGEINFKAKPEIKNGGEIWQSADQDFAAAFVGNKIILGEREAVLNCLAAKASGKNFAQTVQFQNAIRENYAAVTVAKDAETPAKIIETLGKAKENKPAYTSIYTTQTRFAGNGFERRTISDFGLLGMVVEKFGSGN